MLTNPDFKELLNILEGLVIPFISREDLIKAKEASARPQDLLDAENLRKARSEEK